MIPEYGLFLGLSGNKIFYADLNTFQVLGYLESSKAATCFAVNWQKLRCQEESERELQLCVAAKKKLQFYEWKKSNFCPIKVNECVHVYAWGDWELATCYHFVQSDMNFLDTLRALAWVGDNFIICIKNELFHVSVSNNNALLAIATRYLYCIQMDGTSKDLLTIGTTRTEPCLYPLNEEIFTLSDEMQLSLDSNGKSTPLFHWSDLPISIEYIQPYIIGLLPKWVDIASLVMLASYYWY